VLDRERVAAVREGLVNLGHAATTRTRPRGWRLGWWHRLWTIVAIVLAVLLTVLAVVASVTAAGAVITGHSWGVTMNGVKDSCEKTGFACTVASSIFFTVGPIVILSVAFLYRQFRRVKRPLVQEARDRPSEFVETAGDIVGNVVGRNDLCDIVQADLCDRKGRRPHVIVGGVGAGKTAVLVQLTHRLGRSGAVPVPVRLRDADRDRGVDFLVLAKQRFLRDAQTSLVSEPDAEKIWQRLLKQDRIVVLADGLEEALADDPLAEHERDHRIRVAVSQARRQRYPLVIASRPHDALIGLDAALVHLEPLNKEAALEYIKDGRPETEDQRLGWLVERGVVVDSPLFLQIARDLHECNRLTHRHLNTRGADRVKLRTELMESWIGALIDGTLDGAGKAGARPVPLTARERRATVEQLSALACCGLAEDKLEVTFDMYQEVPADNGGGVAKPRYGPLAEAVRERLEHPRSEQGVVADMQLAVTMGTRLGLVEPRRQGARFPHSIMQAYLASRMIRHALASRDYSDEAFRSPGKEFLVALVMFSRTEAARTCKDPEKPEETWLSWLLDRLLTAVTDQHRQDKKLNLLAAAIEVESVDASGGHVAASTANGIWEGFKASDDSVLDAKLDLVARLGDAALRPLEAREVKAAASPEPRATATVEAVVPAPGLFRELFDISSKEKLYPVRLAAAQQIGAGGNDAFQELEQRFQENTPAGGDGRATLEKLKQALYERDADGAHDPHAERRLSIEAWLLPMLVGSDTSSDVPGKGPAASRLDEWLDLVGAGMPLSIEAALAQGFKYAANRRPQHPFESAKTREHLAKRAEQMLKKADFWFTRLTLLQALCLWRLAGASRRPGEEVDGRRDVAARVNQWIGWPAKAEHRFVLEAAKLVTAAIRTRRPERYIWIDESGVTTKVGSSSSSRGGADAAQKLWIPASSGWLVLHPRAQQLVADVLILLNLAERGESGAERERRLRDINVAELPSCLCDERDEHLRPYAPPGLTGARKARGCKTGCTIGLCPYPSKLEQPYRVELSEAFCRNQREIVGHWGRPGPGPAPWQDASRSQLRQFWTAMEERARV